MKALVLAEYYPRSRDPVLGIWAHRQARATRDAGVEIRVLVLYRPLPPLSALWAGNLAALRSALAQPAHAVLDGLPITYVSYLSPPRPWSYGTWGAWAAPSLARALRRIRDDFSFDLIHAHNAVPAGEAARRALPDAPVVLSVHGGDLYGTGRRRTGAISVGTAMRHARLVLANSAGTAEKCARHGARATRVVHLGADPPAQRIVGGHDTRAAPTGTLGSASAGDVRAEPTLVTVGHLVARKRHADVIRALPRLRERHPELRYVIVGDGPEREPLRRLASSLGVGGIVELRGQLEHGRATAAAHAASLFVLPSVQEAFGVAYVEAMAGGVPAIGCRGEDGPEEIAAAGGGLSLVPPGDVGALTRCIDKLLSDPALRAAEGSAAQETVRRAFTWEACGLETAAAYREALAWSEL